MRFKNNFKERIYTIANENTSLGKEYSESFSMDSGDMKAGVPTEAVSCCLTSSDTMRLVPKSETLARTEEVGERDTIKILSVFI